MKRLIIVCEGPTEQEFCTEVLGVEFAKHDIYVEAPVIKHSHGGSNTRMVVSCLGPPSKSKY